MPDTGEQTPRISTELPSFKRLLLVTDFSGPSVAAAPFAALVAEYYRAYVVVAHVIPPPEREGEAAAEGEPREDRASAEKQLQEFVSRTAVGEYAREAAVAEGPVWDVLAGMVEEKKIDLIVLGTHGRSGVGKLLLGSIAQRIFSLAPCPVMSVSPRAQQSWGPDHKLSRILYATDFKPESLKALPYALSLAKVSEAELVLLHAPEGAEASGEIAMGYHQHLSALVPPECRSWCRSDTLVISGDPARVIVDAAANNRADMIVIGAHAYEGSMAHFQVPLSVAYRVVAHAPCPVLRVRS